MANSLYDLCLFAPKRTNNKYRLHYARQKMALKKSTKSKGNNNRKNLHSAEQICPSSTAAERLIKLQQTRVKLLSTEAY